jgi:hypothetical protein
MKTIYYHLLIDASKSMSPYWNDLTKHLIAHLKKTRQLKAKYAIEFKFSSSAFNTENYFSNAQNVKHFKNLNPQGLTALYDAIMINIHLVKKSIGVEIPIVVFVVLTDGHENASKLYSANQVRQAIVKLQQQGNWKFIFFGAGLDIKEINQVLEIPNFKYHNFDKNELNLAFEVLDQIMEQTLKNIVKV